MKSFFAGRNPAPGNALGNFHDLYGAVPPSAVANSQLHHRSPILNSPLGGLQTDSVANNAVEFQGSVSVVGASANGDLVLALGNLAAQRQVVLKGGYMCAFENIVVGGQPFDMREWLQTNATRPVNLTAQNGQSVSGAGGDDQLTFAPGARNVMLNEGKGNDYYATRQAASRGVTIRRHPRDEQDSDRAASLPPAPMWSSLVASGDQPGWVAANMGAWI